MFRTREQKYNFIAGAQAGACKGDPAKAAAYARSWAAQTGGRTAFHTRCPAALGKRDVCAGASASTTPPLRAGHPTWLLGSAARDPLESERGVLFSRGVRGLDVWYISR